MKLSAKNRNLSIEYLVELIQDNKRELFILQNFDLYFVYYSFASLWLNLLKQRLTCNFANNIHNGHDDRDGGDDVRGDDDGDVHIHLVNKLNLKTEQQSSGEEILTAVSVPTAVSISDAVASSIAISTIAWIPNANDSYCDCINKNTIIQ